MAVNLIPDCILQYKFNDTQGDDGTVKDSSQASINGMLVSGTPANRTIIGKLPATDPLAFSFPGTFPPPIYIGRGAPPLSIPDPWSVTVWVYHNENTNSLRYFLGNGSDSGGNAFAIQNNPGTGGTITFYPDGGAPVAWNSVDGVGDLYQTWTMLTFLSVAGGTQMQLFINNSFISTKTVATPWDYSSVGYANNAIMNTYKGRLDDLCIFKKMLLPEDRDFKWNNGDGTEELAEPVLFSTRFSLQRTASTIDKTRLSLSRYSIDV